MSGLPSRLYLSSVRADGKWNENMIAPLVLGCVMSVLFALALFIFSHLYFKKVSRRMRLYRRLGAERGYLALALLLEWVVVFLVSLLFGWALDSLLYGFVNSFKAPSSYEDPLILYMNWSIFGWMLLFSLPAPLLVWSVSGIALLHSYDIRLKKKRLSFGGLADGQN